MNKDCLTMVVIVLTLVVIFLTLHLTFTNYYLYSNFCVFSSCKFLNTRSMSAKRKREEENESYSKMRESVFNSCIIKLRPVPGVRKEPSLRRNVLLYNTLKHIRNEICRSESVASTPEVFSPVHYEDSVVKINDDLPGSLAENQENESIMMTDSEAEEEMTPEPNIPEPSEVPLNLVPVNDVKMSSCRCSHRVLNKSDRIYRI